MVDIFDSEFVRRYAEGKRWFDEGATPEQREIYRQSVNNEREIIEASRKLSRAVYDTISAFLERTPGFPRSAILPGIADATALWRFRLRIERMENSDSPEDDEPQR